MSGRIVPKRRHGALRASRWCAGGQSVAMRESIIRDNLYAIGTGKEAVERFRELHGLWNNACAVSKQETEQKAMARNARKTKGCVTCDQT